jgi:hypothetical protein
VYVFKVAPSGAAFFGSNRISDMKTDKLILILIIVYAFHRYALYKESATGTNTPAALQDAARVKAELLATTNSLESRIAALESANGVSNGVVLSNQSFYI